MYMESVGICMCVYVCMHVAVHGGCGNECVLVWTLSACVCVECTGVSGKMHVNTGV